MKLARLPFSFWVKGFLFVGVPLLLFFKLRGIVQDNKRTIRTGGSIQMLAFSGDGNRVTSFGPEKKVWNIQDRKLVDKQPLPLSDYIPSLSSDGRTFVTSDRDRKDNFYVKLWDVETQQLKHTFHTALFMQYQRRSALSQDGRTLATHNLAGNPSTPGYHWPDASGEQIKVWDVPSGKKLTMIQLQGLTAQGQTTLTSLALSRDGKTLVAGSYQGEIWIWNARTGQLLKKLKEKQEVERGFIPGVCEVALSPDETVVAGASANDKIRLWDMKTGNLLLTIATTTDNDDQALVFSPDGRLLASAGDTATGKVWNSKTGALKQTLGGHATRIKAICFSPDSKFVATGDISGAMKIWNVE